MRIGVVTELGGEGYQPGVLTRFGEAVELLESLGAKIEFNRDAFASDPRVAAMQWERFP